MEGAEGELQLGSSFFQTNSEAIAFIFINPLDGSFPQSAVKRSMQILGGMVPAERVISK